jgi:hypothetical protein
MATCKSIIDGALRKLGVLASGRSATDQEYEDSMEALRSSYRTWINQGVFGKFNEVTVQNDCYTARPNEHIYRLSGQDIQLPGLIRINENRGDDYGWGQPGVMSNPHGDYGITPPDGSMVRITDNDTSITLTWIFDGTTKQWVNLDDLLLTDEAPLSERDSNGFKAFMAVILSEEFAMEVGPVALQQSRHFTHNLAARPASYKFEARKEFV